MKMFMHQFLMAIALVGSFWSFSGYFQPACASDEPVVINIPVYRQVIHNDLVEQAETLVSDAINRQFQQNANLSSVQVHVVGDRNGEIIPILSATVSRVQWQETPQIRRWVRYYSPSYALIQRHETAETVALAPVSSTRINSVETSSAIRFDHRYRIDNAYDAGVLSEEVAQDYLSDLD